MNKENQNKISDQIPDKNALEKYNVNNGDTNNNINIILRSIYFLCAACSLFLYLRYSIILIYPIIITGKLIVSEIIANESPIVMILYVITTVITMVPQILIKAKNELNANI